MNNTKIEWCTRTLNPVVGCSFGCPYCYARKLNKRFGFVEDFSKPQFFPDRLKQLYSKKPQNIFMDSMSDIADWNEKWIHEVAKAMNDNPQHNYLFLTKRPEEIHNRIVNFVRILWQKNVWIGITVTKNTDKEERFYELTILKRKYRVDCNLFVSFEPLHENLSHELFYESEWFSWYIIGAETGKRKEKIVPKYSWVTTIEYEAMLRIPNIPVFMKDSLIPIVGEENMRREFPIELKHYIIGVDSAAKGVGA